jgi:hypothetical protein
MSVAGALIFGGSKMQYRGPSFAGAVNGVAELELPLD